MGFLMPLCDYSEIGIVIIGRNEGERLKRCFSSLPAGSAHIVYVDSDSYDGSVKYAQSQDIEVVQLGPSTLFSAGRARNRGVDKLLAVPNTIQYIQFIDGDCQIYPQWLETAYRFLENNHEYAIVAGQRKELFPEHSLYNLLCDIEWNTPVGDTEACGGDFMIRKNAFLEVGGFDSKVIAGEEPEICFRLLRKGWKIYRYDSYMTGHDAAMTKLSQWWNRSKRSGHAYAQGFFLHGLESEKFCAKAICRIIFWGFLLPLTVTMLGYMIDRHFLLLFLLYPLQALKVAVQSTRRAARWHHALLYSVFVVLAKFPQFIGVLLFFFRRFSKRRFAIIEYK
jgi:GT2 family glycosyltransferase